jgi:hypothetical protein
MWVGCENIHRHISSRLQRIYLSSSPLVCAVQVLLASVSTAASTYVARIACFFHTKRFDLDKRSRSRVPFDSGHTRVTFTHLEFLEESRLARHMKPRTASRITVSTPGSSISATPSASTTRNRSPTPSSFPLTLPAVLPVGARKWGQRQKK